MEKSFFDFLRRKKQEWSKNPRARLSQAEVNEANALNASQYDRNASVSPSEPATAPPAVAPDKGLSSKKGPLAAIVGPVAATALLMVIPQFEGTKYQAYKDIAGIWTICQGDTKDVHAGLIETPQGCMKRLDLQLSIHAKGMMLCTPTLGLEGRDWQRAAGTSLTYNIGIGAYCRSTVDKKWDVGQWSQGCDAFISWNKARVNGVLRPVSGLTSRRRQEIQICGTNLMPGWTPENLQQRMKGVA